jgi:hypothetical protein
LLSGTSPSARWARNTMSGVPGGWAQSAP